MRMPFLMMAKGKASNTNANIFHLRSQKQMRREQASNKQRHARSNTAAFFRHLNRDARNS